MFELGTTGSPPWAGVNPGCLRRLVACAHPRKSPFKLTLRERKAKAAVHSPNAGLNRLLRRASRSASNESGHARSFGACRPAWIEEKGGDFRGRTRNYEDYSASPR